MDKNSTKPLSFSQISNKRIEADFDGGEVTSDAGVLLLKETERQVGIIDAFSNCITDRRDERYVTQPLRDMLSQRIYQIASGYEDGNDCNSLRNDPAFKVAVGRLPISGEKLASQPTISRLENDISRTELLRLGYSLVDNFINSYLKHPSIIILDFDDTEDKTHGNQQLTLFNGYYDSHCYLPLHVYEGMSGKLIGSILKPGKRSTGKQIVAILKRLVKKLRSAWPDTIILFRGDSHFCTPEVLQFCDENDLQYCIGLSGNNVLHQLVRHLILEAKSIFAQTNTKIRLYESFTYQAGSWDKTQQVTAKVEVNENGCNYRFVVNNLYDSDPATIYKYVYCGRGKMENYIKNHKLFLKSDRTSCNSFEANQFRLFLHSASYVLIHAFQENILKTTEFATAQFDSICLRLLKVGAKVREMKTKIKLHLPSSFPFKHIFSKACEIFCTLRAT